MAKLVEINVCPNCGARAFERKGDTLVCPYCDTVFAIDEDVSYFDEEPLFRPQPEDKPQFKPASSPAPQVVIPAAQPVRKPSIIKIIAQLFGAWLFFGAAFTGIVEPTNDDPVVMLFAVLICLAAAGAFLRCAIRNIRARKK